MIGFTLTCCSHCPTLQYDLYSLDVAAVREEHITLLTNVGLIPAKLYSEYKYCGCRRMHQLHTVKGCTTAVIHMAETGVSVLPWTMSAVTVPRAYQGVHLELILIYMVSGVCHQNYHRLS